MDISASSIRQSGRSLGSEYAIISAFFPRVDRFTSYNQESGLTLEADPASVMMRISGFKDNIFPQESMPVFNNVANLGLIVFLFLVALDMSPLPKKVVDKLEPLTNSPCTARR